ncbi:MAG: cation:proton antiporter [Sandaracinaceae bacterium]|nr:cation:proton antiporter [Sandaracinaceae bacterium]
MAIEVTFFALLVVAGLVALLARRMRWPYTVALVGAGLALGTLPKELTPIDLQAVRLTPELLFNLFLPILLFEAAFHLSWAKFRANLRAILLLAVPGVALGIGLGALFAYILEPLADVNVPFGVALLFSSMLAATDPVSVIALFKELGVPKRLGVIMEGESLLNDAVGVVAFTVMVALLGLSPETEKVTPIWIARFLLWEIVVAIAAGAAIGLFTSWVTTLVDDHLIEIMLTTIAAFGSYILAAFLHASPVLAVVASGMACGNVGARYGMTPSNRIAVSSFWEYAVFATNGFVFLLLGKEIDLMRMVGHTFPIFVAWISLTLARALVVIGIERLLRKTKERFELRWTAVLTWGGLRGSLSMVLALSLPLSFAHRDLVLDLTYGVVLFSILVQGTTMTPLLRWAGVVGKGENYLYYLRLKAQLRAVRAAFFELDRWRSQGEIDEETFELLRSELAGRQAELEEQLAELQGAVKEIKAKEFAQARRKLFESERALIQELESKGELPTEVARAILRDINRREHKELEPEQPPSTMAELKPS